MYEIYVLLTIHLVTVFVNNQLDAQFFFLYSFIPILYMFQVTNCSSSGESIVSKRLQVYSGTKRDGGFQPPPPPEIQKALQNCAKLNPIVKNVKNC